MIRKTYRLRLPLLIAAPVLLLAVLGVRLHYLQVVYHDHYLSRAGNQQRVSIPIRPKRGVILSHDGLELAISTPAYAVYSETHLVTDNHRELAERLQVILGGSETRFLKLLNSGKVVTLGRKVDRRTKERLEMLSEQFRLPRYAIRFEEEGERHYPKGDLAAHLVGFASLDEYGDNKGLAGLEAQFDEQLRGSTAKFEAARTAVQKRLEPIAEEAYRRAFGDSLVLTIESTIQQAAQDALDAKCRELSAAAGVAVVYEVKTGRILGLANWPTFNLNQYARAGFNEMRNRAVVDAIEPGSVAKTLAMAILLDAGLISPDTYFDCEGGRAYIKGRRVTDAPGHRLHLATIREIFKYSSNVGTNKAAQLIEPSAYNQYLQRFGVGQLTGIELPGEVAGMLRPFNKWSGFTMTSLPMGYEMRTTAIQMAAACGAIANGGILMKPYIVDEVYDHAWRLKSKTQPVRVRRVIGPLAAAQTLQLLEDTVASGTGKKAQVAGYRVGGKTGTTHKYDTVAGGYSPTNYISSFFGVFPLSNPEVLVYVYIDDPKGKKYGGDVAAPVFQEITEETIRVLGMRPDALDTGLGGFQADTERTLAEARNRQMLPPGEQSPITADRTRNIPELSPLPGGMVGSGQELMAADSATTTSLSELPPSPVPPPPSFDELVTMSPEERHAARQAHQRAIERSTAPPMPELTGMTMAAARQAIQGLPGQRFVFVGSGLVAQQDPAPGIRVDPQGVVTVTFAP